MENYKCPRCHYRTPSKTNFKKHFQRQVVCEAKYNDISINEILNDLYPKKKHQCVYCEKSYNCPYYLQRHINEKHHQENQSSMEKAIELIKKLKSS